MSLRTRMGISAGVAVALAVVAVAFFSYEGTRSELRNQVDNSLQSIASVIHAPSGNPGGGGPGPSGPGGPQTARGGQGGGEPIGVGDEGLDLDLRPGPQFGGARGITTVIHHNGSVYVPTGQTYGIPIDERMKEIAESGHGRLFTDLTTHNAHIRVLVTGIGARGALAAALPLADVDRTLSHELLLLALIAAAGVLVAALLGFLVARTAVAPIASFTRQAERIATNPERVERERLEVTGSDELSRLARTFNATLDALERSIGAQRNLVADASHELRTPIATIRANLQLMRDERLLPPEDREALRRDVIEELDELTRLVGDVVELARGSKAVAEPGDLRLDQIVAEALERARRRGPELRFEAELEPTLIRGAGDRVARAITNLLDNAIKWSAAGDVVEVGLREGVLSVRDHGPGFHDADLPFVFDRFHRARDARSKPGSGLGLAIVRQAAEAHGGFVAAGNAPGGGALMRISFGEPVPLGEADPDEPAAAQPAADPPVRSSG